MAEYYLVAFIRFGAAHLSFAAAGEPFFRNLLRFKNIVLNLSLK